MKNYISLLALVLLLGACKEPVDPPVPTIPELRVQEGRVFENANNPQMTFFVSLSDSADQEIAYSYSLEGLTAAPGVDFNASEGSGTVAVGATKFEISVPILDDTENEVDEKFLLKINSASNANIIVGQAVGVIQDNDSPVDQDPEGYITANSYYGYELAWEESFDGPELDSSIYNFDLDDGCPNLCGWGNQEEQWYTDGPPNVTFENGKLVITATKTGAASYKSARINTRDKLAFQYGRIDIRARLPKGQGIWPAIWMLGENIGEVGWPACGEIDIMEMVGHQSRSSHGTAHWGAEGAAGSTYSTAVYTIDEDFQEKFHVFSIVWEEDELVWYVDETPFHSISPADMKGEAYRFNQPFFFVFNVAVGGQWPGSPDASTIFPQSMELDYVRVFQ